MSIWSQLLNIGSVAAAPFTGGASLAGLGIGQALGGAAQSMAGNREAKYAGQMDLAKLLMDRDLSSRQLNLMADNAYQSNAINREQEGRIGQQDAWRKLLSAQHVASPTALPTVSKYQAPQRLPTAIEASGADALSQQVLARLQGGNPLPAVERSNVAPGYDPSGTIDPKLLNAGILEKLLGIGSAVVPGLGLLGGSRSRPQAGGQMVNSGLLRF